MERMKVNGVELSFEHHGRGTPVLLVHGFPLSSALWQSVISPLAKRHWVIAPDLRGMGQSEATADASMETYADDLSGLLDGLGSKEPVALVGLSMGGYIAFEFFRRNRDRVRAMVLADTRAEADTPEAAKARLETAEKVLREGSGVVVDAMTPKLFAKSASKALVEQWRAIMLATKPMGVAAALRAMSARADSTNTLPEIRVPALVLVGEEDAITPPATARTMHAGIAGSQIKLIPDCGHMSPVEKPEQFARICGEFLHGAIGS
ncbi:MAG: alpha/beta fold hydrolase [Phycisphaerae bacterium]|nr:alpha/beta fold hydrolase [Phycisphaerae bacterium]